MRTPALLQPALFLAPALALWLVLALGRYPGEAVVARLSRRQPRASRRKGASESRRPSSMHARAPRNLLAGSLAGRAPPPAAKPSQ